MKTALILFILLSVIGVTLLTVSAYMIFGYQYATLTASICSLTAAYLIKKGLTNG